MRLSQVWLFCLLVIAMCLVGCGGTEEMFGEKGTVRGYVEDNQGRRLSSVTVSCGSDNCKTDESGFFSLQDVSTGSRKVQASKAGYFDAGDGSITTNVIEGNNNDVGTLVLIPRTTQGINVSDLDRSSSSYCDKGPITLAGVLYRNSLLRRGYVLEGDLTYTVTYALNSRYSRFKATVGIPDDASSSYVALVFQVTNAITGDVLYTSPSLAVNSQPATIDIDVSNINSLGLKVLSDTGDYAYFSWCDPVLVPKEP